MAGVPIVLEAAIEVNATKGEDGVSAVDRPEHAGLFGVIAGDGFAARLDHARTDELLRQNLNRWQKGLVGRNGLGLVRLAVDATGERCMEPRMLLDAIGRPHYLEPEEGSGIPSGELLALRGSFPPHSRSQLRPARSLTAHGALSGAVPTLLSVAADGKKKSLLAKMMVR